MQLNPYAKDGAWTEKTQTETGEHKEDSQHKEQERIQMQA